MAPNVTLALEILRMPNLELIPFLQQQGEINPFLEVDLQPPDGTFESLDGSAPPGSTDDWTQHWSRIGGPGGHEREDSDEPTGPEQFFTKPATLYESLLLQLGCQKLDDETHRIGETLIERLNESGYLDGTLEELSQELQLDVPTLEGPLKIIQSFDPPGVGARDLRECLMLQLEQRQATESLPYRILRDHFQLFVKQRWEQIARATGTTPQAVTRAADCLRRLNPKPGRAFSGQLPQTVVPDLIVHKREEYYDVELNDRYVPQVGISRSYYRMLQDPQTSSEVKEFLQQKFRQASWVIKAIDERNSTLLAIARALLSLQREFLDQGPAALKPLTQARVASVIGRHPSTVSRAIAGKFIDCPCGVFPLEELFASGVAQSERETDTVSDGTIKSEIQKILSSENPAHPLSDDTIAKQLKDRNIVVARRTIAKYRTSLKILPAHLRRQRA